MKYNEMSKFDLISCCVKQQSEIERLKWELDTEKKLRIFDKGLCPMNKTLQDDIIACVYNCEDCYERRKKQC